MSESKIPITKKETHPPCESVKINGTAGCGKTTQSFLRLLHEMERRNLEYRDITVCTYRNSLAREQLNKLKDEDVIPDEVQQSDTFIGTIHGICRRLINLSDEVDMKINNLATGYHKEEFCKQYDKKYFSSSFEKSAGEVLFNIFSYVYNNNVEMKHIPQELLDDFREAWSLQADVATLNRLWEDWQEFKNNPPTRETILYDFDELLLIVRELELVPPNKFIIIDEMHDAYPLLNDVVQMWIKNTLDRDDGTVIVAGDPLQVINSYQGASPEFYTETDLPEIVLDTTYRCSSQVWNYAENIITKEFDIQNINTVKEGSILEYDVPTFSYSENEWGIDNESGLTPEKLTNEYDELMFLARTRIQLNAISKRLDEEGILYAGQVSNSWTENTELLHIYNFLQTLTDVDLTGKYVIDFDESFVFNFDDDIITTRKRIEHILEVLPDEYIRSSDAPKNQILKYDRPFAFELRDTYFAFKPDLFNTDIKELIDQLDLSNFNKDRLKKALDKYDDVYTYTEIPVSLRTIHESKGMQAETVALYDGITQNIIESLETQDGRNSECRTWFVGATRAADNLLILRDGFKGFESSPYLPKV